MLNQLVADFLAAAWLVLGGCGSAAPAAAFPQVGIGEGTAFVAALGDAA